MTGYETPPLEVVSDDDDFGPKEIPGEWADQAACMTVPNAADLFFPDRGQSTAEAKAICRSCPVQPQCLEHAVRVKEKFGIWGGKSERERRRIRHAAGARRRGPQGGTAA